MATDFLTMIYGNSDNVKLGQWVLAVGYPLTLETTVTAGIISAKGKINRYQWPSEPVHLSNHLFKQMQP